MKSRFFPALILLMSLSVLASGGEILKNPGFEEDVDNNGFPDNWTRQRLAVIDRDPINAFQGNVSVKTSAWHAYIQIVPLVPGTRMCFSGFLKGDVGGEFSAMSAEFRSETELLDYQRGTFFPPEAYSPYAASFLAPLGTATSKVIFSATFFSEWTRGDAFSAVDEFIHNPDFENINDQKPDDWFKTGEPLIDVSGQNAFSGDSEVRCRTGHYFYQDLALYRDKTYCLFFHARTDDASITPENIHLQFFDENLDSAGEERISFTAEPVYRQFSHVFTPPENAVMARLSLEPQRETNTPLWFDAFGIFAAASVPQTFSPNNDQIYDRAELVILAGADSSVTANVLSPDSGSADLVRSIAEDVSLERGVVKFPWDGTSDNNGSADPGNYIFNLEMTTDYSEIVEFSIPVTVNNPSALSGPRKDLSGFFPRGLWLYQGGRFGQNLDYDVNMGKISDGDFNAAIVHWTPEERLGELMQAADKHDIRIIPHVVSLDSLIGKHSKFEYEQVPESELRKKVSYAVDSLSTHTSLLGYHISDEIKEKYFESAHRAVLALRGMDPEHPAFSSIPAVSDLLTPLEELDTAVMMHHYYPIDFGEPVSPEAFDDLLVYLERASEAARKKGRPLWMILQGFSQQGRRRFPTPEEMYCQVWLALAHGAKGIFYFTGRSFFFIHGFFDYNNEPFPIYHTVVEINHVLEQLAPTLLELEQTESFCSAPPDHFTACFLHSSGTPHVIIVNKDCLSTRTVDLALETTSTGSIRDVLTGEEFSFYNEAGDTHVDLEMPPGRGRLLEISPSVSTKRKPSRIPREALYSAFGMGEVFTAGDLFQRKEREIHSAILSHVPLNGPIKSVHVADDLAAVTAGNSGLYIIDVTRPWRPKLEQTISDLHFYGDARVRGDHIFIADPRGGMPVLSRNSSGDFVKSGEWWGVTGSPFSMHISEDRAWAASESHGLSILDIADPQSPKLIARGESADNVRYILRKDDYAFLVDEYRGIRVEDVSTTVPKRIAFLPMESPFEGDLDEDRMAISCGEYGLRLVSVDDPENPVITDEIPMIHTDNAAFYRDEWVFASAGLDGVAVIHWPPDGNPVLEKYFQPFPGYYARRVFIDDPYMYVLYSEKGLYVMDPGRILAPGKGKDFQGFSFY